MKSDSKIRIEDWMNEKNINSSDWMHEDGKVLGSMLVAKEFDKMIPITNKILKADKTDIRALLYKGCALIGLDKFQDALVVFSKAIETDSENFLAYRSKAIALKCLGKNKEAEEYVNLALDLESDDVSTLALKVEIISNLKRYDEVLKITEEVLESEPENIKALTARGSALRSLERFNESLVCFDKALKIEPDDSDLLANKSLTLGCLGRNSEALEIVEKELALDPEDWFALIRKGIFLCKSLKTEEGIKYFDKVLKKDPNNEHAKEYKKVALKLPSPEEQILQMTTQLIAFYPRVFKWVKLKALTLNGLQRHKEALKCIDDALKIRPNDLSMLAEKVTALIELGEYRKVNLIINKILKEKPKNIHFVGLKGVLMNRLNKPKEALEIFEEVEKLQKTEKKLNTKFRIMSLHTLVYEEAVKTMDALMENDVDNIEFLKNKRCFLNHLKKYKETLKISRRLVILDSNKVERKIDVALCLHVLEKNDIALRSIDKILKQEPNNKGALTVRKLIIDAIETKEKQLLTEAKSGLI